MDLADRGGGDGVRVEGREARLPVRAPFACEDPAELFGRHPIGLLAQLRHDRGQFGGQEIARVHRNHLAQFHRRPAQMRQPIGEAANIAGRQQQVAHLRALAPRKPPRAFSDHAACDTAC